MNLELSIQRLSLLLLRLLPLVCWLFPSPLMATVNLSAKISLRVTGPEQTVYQWQSQRCEDAEIPDAAVRAFRDWSGTVHVIIASERTRALLGPNLNNVEPDCRVLYKAGGSASPAAFDDQGWLESFYTADGKSIVGLVSLDYHPSHHGISCGTAIKDSAGCWYSAIVAAQSTDGGMSFHSPASNLKRLVAGPAYQLNTRNPATLGALVPSNIILLNNYYYVMISVLGRGLQGSGECLLRTKNLADPASWRAWNGSTFSGTYTDPYLANSHPQEFCAPLLDVVSPPVRSLVFWNGRFLLISFRGPDRAAKRDSAVIAQASLDLVHWSEPITVVNLPIYLPNAGPKGKVAYDYPSMLDPNSTSRDFATVGNTAYLYLTKYRYGGGLNRDLVRFPVSIKILK